jgi:hypothetical protein
MFWRSSKHCVTYPPLPLPSIYPFYIDLSTTRWMYFLGRWWMHIITIIFLSLYQFGYNLMPSLSLWYPAGIWWVRMRNHNAAANNNNNKIMTISMPCKAPPPEGLYRNGVHTQLYHHARGYVGLICNLWTCSLAATTASF